MENSAAENNKMEINTTENRYRGTDCLLAKRIQERLEEKIREKGAGAVCAAVCADGELLAAACAGTRGFEDSMAEVDDLYNVGSVSKIYVTAAIMKLVQEGRLALDHPVTMYLPDWKLADDRYPEITIRMLLNHSSGIPGTNLHDELDMNYSGGLFTGKYRNTPEYWSAIKLRAKPGSFSSYGNDGFDLLAEVVEGVTGKPYIEWLREQIAEPAGLSSIGEGKWSTEGRVKVSCKGKAPEFYNCFGAGAIHTTVPECAMFGYLFIDSQGIIGQAYLDDTRHVQGKTFLKGVSDAEEFCLGWDSLYTRDRIPLGEGAVIKDGGTEQFRSFLIVSPARRMSMAISATSDNDVWWLEVLEEIGAEALKVLGRDEKEEAGREQQGVSLNKAQAALEDAGSSAAVPQEVVDLYSGIAYGSRWVYRFTVCGDTLNMDSYGKNGSWERKESFSGFRWNGSCFAKGENDRILAEEYKGKVYYIRWGTAFCQKNGSYPSPGKVWPQYVGKVFSAVSPKETLGNVCLREINEDNVLIFTTGHENHPVVPLVCDPRKEKETCLISETTREGIVFRLEEDETGVWLGMGTDRYNGQR